MVEIVGRSRAEQNIRVGDRWLVAGVWFVGDGGVVEPATMALRSLSELELKKDNFCQYADE